ncbi:hypothetical protein HDV05_000263, partial [Chytridiales sp. JEL 0842]
CLLITAYWYPKREHATKIAIWFAWASIGSALGGIIAYGIQKNLAIGGYKGWAWLMFIEGAATVLWSLLSFFVTPDVPEKVKFLTEEEKTFVINRLKEDKTHSSLEYNKVQTREALLDYKTWMLAFIYFCWSAVTAALAFFGPTIIRGLGFSALDSQLLAAPFAAFSYILQLSISYLSDRANNRSRYLLLSGLIAIAGLLAVILIVPDKSSRTLWTLYSCYFFSTFVPGSLTMVLGWTTSNIVGHTKRTIAVTIVSLASAVGGFAGSFVYVPADAPRYIGGHSVNIGLLVLGMLCTLALVFLLNRENNRRDALGGAHGEEIGLNNPPIGHDDMNETDYNLSFRYQL